MQLRHPGTSEMPLAFKVKTTQPRRYLVRPNQGVLNANDTVIISVLLVDKDKQSILSSYRKLGVSVLEQNKDKFLIQSVFSDDTEEDVWSKVGSSPEKFWNKKLHVKHVVEVEKEEPSGVEELSKEQLAEELASLKKKYEELVQFSVNLTAERDVLNRNLEAEKKKRAVAVSTSEKNKGGGGNLFIIILVAVLAFYVGKKLQL